MAFTEAERAARLAAPLVGPGVVRRLEEIGLDRFETLAEAEALRRPVWPCE
jgi:hypothetical protein